LSEHNTRRARRFRRNADVASPWWFGVLHLGFYAKGIHDLLQHVYVHAALWLAFGLGGTWTFTDNMRQARLKAERARQQRLAIQADMRLRELRRVAQCLRLLEKKR
jgi:hypothetical protein